MFLRRPARSSEKDLPSALGRSRVLNRMGMKALLSLTEQSKKSKFFVEKSVRTQLQLLEGIRENALKADALVKPGSMGIGVGKGWCLENLIEIAQRAAEFRTFVWIGAESREHAGDLAGMYLEVLRHSKCAGLTLQANLKRTRGDLIKILGKGGRVRLVPGKGKGDFRNSAEAECNFSRLLRILFSRGDNFAIGAGSEFLGEIKTLSARYNKKFEFQLHHKSKKKLRRHAAREFPVSVLVPFR